MTADQGVIQPPHGLMNLRPESFWLQWGTWILFALAILAFGMVVYFFWRKRRKKEVYIDEHIPISVIDPWEGLRIRLSALESAPLEPQSKLEEFCLGLSGILREALELCYQFPATGQTLGELTRSLQKLEELGATIRDPAIEFLNWADQIKFAGKRSDIEAAKRWYNEVRKWSLGMEQEARGDKV